MAGNAVIGALRVNLGLDSAQFESGLKRSQSSMAGFGKAAGAAAAAVAAAAAAAGVAFAAAVKGATDVADGMSKAAQRAGVATEALSRLNYAAGLSDVSMAQLSSGLGRLSNTMSQVAKGAGGPAASAFSALGVSVTDATGRLRASDAVFIDVADKLSKMENGSQKTALAIQIFGRSGAELLPMLNQGRAGLAAMAAESDRLGMTISTSAGIAAEKFNDNLTRLSNVASGAANRLAAELLPMMSAFSDGVAEAAINTEGFKDQIKSMVDSSIWATGQLLDFLDRVGLGYKRLQLVGVAVADAINQAWLSVAQTVMDATTAVRDSYNAFARVIPFMEEVSSVDPGQAAWVRRVQQDADDARASLRAIQDEIAAWTSSSLPSESLNQWVESARATAESAASGVQSAFNGIDLEPVVAELGRAGDAAETLGRRGLYGWELWGQGMENARGQMADALFSMAGNVTKAMGGMLGDSKAFAVAEILISTAQAVMKALAQTGPLGWANAAAMAAAGVAQISAVNRAQPGVRSMPAVNGGVAAAPVMRAPSSSDGARMGQVVNVTLAGNGRYSREDIRHLLEALNSGMDDGMQLNVNGAW